MEDKYLFIVPIKSSGKVQLDRAVGVLGYAHMHYSKEIRVFTELLFLDQNGDVYSEPGVVTQERILRADNNDVVNPANGIICKDNGSGVFVDALGTTVDTPVPQYDYYNSIFNKGAVDIKALLQQTIQAEDQVYGGWDKK